MAGPVSSVLLPTPCDARLLDQLRDWLSPRIVSGSERMRPTPPWEISITLPEMPVGTDALDDPPVLTVEVAGLTAEGEDHDRGLRSREEFLFIDIMWRNRNIDHHCLASVSGDLARAFDGAVDVGGALNLPLTLREEALATKVIVEVPYEGADGQIHFNQIASPTFLETWRSHAHFRMVK